MKEFPWRCGICRERALSPAEIHYQATLQHDRRDYALQLDDLKVLKCSTCGNVVLDDGANRRLSDALRTAASLLAPEEIKKRRDALRLTAEQLAGFLGIPVATLLYWEAGSQIQSRSMDKLLRGFFDVPAYRSYLGFPSDGSTTIPGRHIDL